MWQKGQMWGVGRECCGSGKEEKVRGAILETGNNFSLYDEKLR